MSFSSSAASLSFESTATQWGLSAQRAEQLACWLAPWGQVDQLEPLAGDASFRRYYRLRDTVSGQQWMVMDAPPERESCVAFIELAQAWRSAGVRVPELIAQNAQSGFLLLEDFGDQQLMQRVQAGLPYEAHYQQALKQLDHLQRHTEASSLKPYSADCLMNEMALFDTWFLEGLCGLSTTQRPSNWEAFKQQLVSSALAQPQVTVHRDYHSRNLMCCADQIEQGLGILDFQDAVRGPFTYDLVSLLKDCYLAWPAQQQQAWLAAYYQRAQAQQADWRVDWPWARWCQAYDWMGLQRHLKIAGIFARLHLRDHKSRYLADLPLTIMHLHQTFTSYPQFTHLKIWLETTVWPVMTKRLAAEQANSLECSPAP